MEKAHWNELFGVAAEAAYPGVRRLLGHENGAPCPLEAPSEEVKCLLGYMANSLALALNGAALLPGEVIREDGKPRWVEGGGAHPPSLDRQARAYRALIALHVWHCLDGVLYGDELDVTVPLTNFLEALRQVPDGATLDARLFAPQWLVGNLAALPLPVPRDKLSELTQVWSQVVVEEGLTPVPPPMRAATFLEHH